MKPLVEFVVQWKPSTEWEDHTSELSSLDDAKEELADIMDIHERMNKKNFRIVKITITREIVS